MEEARNRVLWLLQIYNLSQTWLINRLVKGGFPDATKYNMSDILRGVRGGEQAERVITASLSILEDYGKWASK